MNESHRAVDNLTLRYYSEKKKKKNSKKNMPQVMNATSWSERVKLKNKNNSLRKKNQH